MKNTVHPEIQIGQRFERLVVLKVSGQKGQKRQYILYLYL